MAVTVNWSSYPYVITVPQSDLTLISGTKYKITVDYLWQLLRDFSDSAEAAGHPVLYRRTASTASTPSITEINDPAYAMEFEDGAYSVDIINGNTNLRDVEVKNTVSIGTNNTTGFIDPVFLEAGLFEGHVTVDVANGVEGTGYTASGGIIGTRSDPSNNIPNATTIAQNRGLKELLIIGSITLDTGDNVSGYIITGQNAQNTMITVNTGAQTGTGTEFRECSIAGILDGGSIVRNSVIVGLNYVSGFIHQCMLYGGTTITLGGANAAAIMSCYSGGSPASPPVIDCGGSGQSLFLMDYMGAVKITNKTGADIIEIALNGGDVELDLANISGGTISVYGDGRVRSTAGDDYLPSGTYNGMTLANQTTQGNQLQELWALAGLDADNPMTVTKTARVAGSISQTISGDGLNTSTVQRD